MSYFSPYIDETGLHIPTYNDVLEELVDAARRIFGPGLYLGTDSQDYQFIATVAEKIYDSYQVAQAVYTTRGPAHAVGAALDIIVGVNGIRRKLATRSSVDLRLIGDPNTVINNGFVSDVNGHVWDLPSSVRIGMDGEVYATATCRTPGLITAAIDTITEIMTPVRGWTSVTNPAIAVVGNVTETDAELRARQALSVAQPSRTVLEGLSGALEEIRDVHREVVFENDTNMTDTNGIPGHSICVVVEGGDEEEIARTIFLKKTPGCGTFGGTEVIVPDQSGYSNAIRFTRPDYVDIYVDITLRKKAGYSSDIPNRIRGLLIDYLDNFSIGLDLVVSILWMVAQEANEDPLNPVFSIVSIGAGSSPDSLTTDDVQIAYNEVVRSNAALIWISEV